ncbi:cytochrome c-type biogenesis protein [Anaerolinea thermophila]|uniref:Cytochrome c-type biogenesis protein n=1 Tax=Anaerolinea thermophila (strain DSM 14523 / JCM 11388 / NBRC 100420 / UNI-1) TaxID=926569 RepID=E8N6A8_ANATU|nr:cytochrome c-type biogenesis protein [Anaerolinea thermophila]BAJ63972.1 cytochrome c-type biogenesis protein CcmH [Anaerolinea thermophila UNI-1]
MSMKRAHLWIFFGLVFLAVLSQIGYAQSPVPTPSDDEVNRIAKQLYCPVCENVPLDVCPTQACSEWRELIRQKLIEGMTEEQIKEYFVLHYGDRVLAEPPRRGLNWLVYILPVVIFLIAVVITVRILRSMRKPVAAMSSSSSALEISEEELKRIEEALKKQGD